MRFLRTTFDVVDRDTLERLLQRAQELKRHRLERRLAPTLSGRVVGMLFERASTRTRASFEAGVALLGGASVILQGRDTQLQTQIEGGEPLRDFARTLGGYVDALVVRPQGAHAIVEELARHAGVPVVNGMSDLDHPCQVITDLFTVFERHEKPFSTTWAFVGDAAPMAHGYIALAAVAGLPLRLALPDPSVLDERIVQRARAAGARIDVGTDPVAAVHGAHVVATAGWSGALKPEVAMRFQVRDALLAGADDDHIVLHPLPARRGHEITDDVLEGMHSVAFQQARNRLPVQQAILEWLLPR